MFTPKENRKVKKEVEIFRRRISRIFVTRGRFEPLDGDATEEISKRVLKELNDFYGNR